MALTKEYNMGMDLTVKTFSGLEEVLAQELKELGATDIEIIKRGVTFRGDMALLYKANYLLRTALRVLQPVGVFKVTDDTELYQKVMKIDWTKVFNVDQTFIVSANVFHSTLTHSHFVALRAKDAIVDQFREKTGKRPWVAKDEADIFIDVHISHDVCSISLDSSGMSLHRRGYRISADKAPISEVLAAGMVKLTGWKGEMDFYDPMCGSGTIPIEAAMQAMNIPAGYYREHFAFMNWAGFDKELWENVKQEADENMGELECEIIASDRSAKAIGITKRNLKQAGLHKDVITKVQYFDEIKPKEKKGILVFNPPYGKRLEERGDIIELYKKIGDTLKQDFTGFEAWIITADFDSPKFIGLKPSKRVTLFNGPIEAKFLKYEMYEGSMKDGPHPRDGQEDYKPRRDFRRSGEGRGSYKRKEGGEGRGGYKRPERGDSRGGYKRDEEGDRRGGFKRKEGGEGKGWFKRKDEGDRRGGFKRKEDGDGRGGYKKSGEGRGSYKRKEEGDGRGGYKKPERGESRGGYKRDEDSDRRGGFKRKDGDRGGYKKPERGDSRGGYKKDEDGDRRGGFKRRDEDRGGFKKSGEGRGSYKRKEGGESKGRFTRSDDDGKGRDGFKKSGRGEGRGGFKRSDRDKSKGGFKRSDGGESKGGFKKPDGSESKFKKPRERDSKGRFKKSEGGDKTRQSINSPKQQSPI